MAPEERQASDAIVGSTHTSVQEGAFTGPKADSPKPPCLQRILPARCAKVCPHRGSALERAEEQRGGDAVTGWAPLDRN